MRWSFAREQALATLFDDIEEQAEGAGRKLILNLLRECLAAEEEAQAQTILCPSANAGCAVLKTRGRAISTPLQEQFITNNATRSVTGAARLFSLWTSA